VVYKVSIVSKDKEQNVGLRFRNLDFAMNSRNSSYIFKVYLLIFSNLGIFHFVLQIKN